MIKKPPCHNRYNSARQRFLKAVIENFFAREFPRFFGPVIRQKVAEQLLSIFEDLHPPSSRLKPGQILWNALNKDTRATSEKRSYVPVVLSLVTPEDIELLANGTPVSTITRTAIARIIQEAYAQGGILSTRDIGLLILRDPSTVSALRIQYEKEHKCQLPHTGLLHDIGSGVSHKALILRKVIIEKKDPAAVARETNHSQKAVDRYLYDYHRVKTVYEQNQDIEYIHRVTALSKYLIKQYVEVIKHETN
ncbi:MAG: DUF1670 domain-containing protein [Deltaproteobacteria bacterium]|nr:DUF1670 domain-containing protein [Deltaproteobacteria bacterium]